MKNTNRSPTENMKNLFFVYVLALCEQKFSICFGCLDQQTAKYTSECFTKPNGTKLAAMCGHTAPKQ